MFCRPALSGKAKSLICRNSKQLQVQIMKERWYGLDIYRIMAMVMITALHINCFNLGMMDRSRPAAVFYTGYLVEYACFAGVNCFAMLSGFMMGTGSWSYDKRWLKKFLLFWLKIITWSVVMYCGAFC